MKLRLQQGLSVALKVWQAIGTMCAMVSTWAADSPVAADHSRRSCWSQLQP